VGTFRADFLVFFRRASSLYTKKTLAVVQSRFHKRIPHCPQDDHGRSRTWIDMSQRSLA
jgi:hypothetical protein